MERCGEMTQKEVLDYIINDTDFVSMADCPPDVSLGKSKCGSFGDCEACWKNFVDVRYKKHKLDRKGH